MSVVMILRINRRLLGTSSNSHRWTRPHLDPPFSPAKLNLSLVVLGAVFTVELGVPAAVLGD